MKKEIKKLESRQDVLDVWVNKGAKLHDEEITNVYHATNMGMIAYFCIRGETMVLSIYDLIYAPESNFFRKMYGAGWCDLHKKNCVTEPDPLSYLIKTLNETTS